MALDVTDGFTLGGLDNAPGGNSVRILHVAGEIVGLDGTGTYTVTADGTITGSDGGADADLVLDDGAGVIITVADYDADSTGTAPENVFATMKFTFGSAVATSNCLTVLGGFMSCGLDEGGGTVGAGAFDLPASASLHTISGNSITFALSALEVEGGSQETVDADTIVKFSVMAFARGGTV
tara:strand:- start:21 stop:563 length:543 start_codon:yes stop_codon:yes gene_type:complete